MRVLHILDSLNQGGAEQLALDVCRNGSASGLDITLVALGGGELSEQFRLSGVNYIQLHRQTPLDVNVIRQIRRIIKDQQIEVVHSHQAVEGLHAYFATLGTGVKRVMSFHGYTRDRKNRAVLKFLIPRMHANIAVSQQFLGQLSTKERLEISNFRIIHNGIDTRRLQATARGIKRELGLAPDQILLGMVGSFSSAVRDHLTVCQALTMLFDQSSNVHFVFVGGRSSSSPKHYEDCINYCNQQGIADRAHFLGLRSDVPNILSELDGFVFSSKEDTFGIALVEALLMGVPAIISDIPTLLEVSCNGRYAQLFKAGDPCDLSEKMLSFIKQPWASTERARQAQIWAQREFSVEAHLNKLKHLYHSLAQEQAEGLAA